MQDGEVFPGFIEPEGGPERMKELREFLNMLEQQMFGAAAISPVDMTRSLREIQTSGWVFTHSLME